MFSFSHGHVSSQAGHADLRGIHREIRICAYLRYLRETEKMFSFSHGHVSSQAGHADLRGILREIKIC
ncbi:MAG: hypothetical protein AB7D35_08565, partial [Bacteroidales bacterium]